MTNTYEKKFTMKNSKISNLMHRNLAIVSPYKAIFMIQQKEL